MQSPQTLVLTRFYRSGGGVNPFCERVLDFSANGKLKEESGKLNPPIIVPPLDGEARRGNGKTLAKVSKKSNSRKENSSSPHLTSPSGEEKATEKCNNFLFTIFNFQLLTTGFPNLLFENDEYEQSNILTNQTPPPTPLPQGAGEQKLGNKQLSIFHFPFSIKKGGVEC